jgi:hypothetical protein
MNAFTNYLEKLGSNFLVAAMVPSLAFVLTGILVFDSILHIGEAFKDPQGTYQLVGFGLLGFVITVIIGFTLTALNTFILKMFEGYVTPFPVRFLYSISRRIHRKRAIALKSTRNDLENQIRDLEDHHPEAAVELETLRAKYYKAASNYDLNYPENEEHILPTRFGNTLKASENYPAERYGFDGVQLWPRLVHAIPVEYRASIDSARNELSFLVNMSILSICFSLVCVLALFYVMWVSPVTTDPASYLAFLSKATKYLIAAAVGFLSCGFFYNASIFAVSSFGLVIRSAFDLFRLDLLKKLNMERPKNSIEEFDTWYNLNELLVLGGHSLTFQQLNYREKE